jgi:hypothetical protein
MKSTNYLTAMKKVVVLAIVFVMAFVAVPGLTAVYAEALEEKLPLNNGVVVELAPGTYEAINAENITVPKNGKMFKSIKATLTVNEDGSAVLVVDLSSSGYGALYYGPKMADMPDGKIDDSNIGILWDSEDLELHSPECAKAKVKTENDRHRSNTLNLDGVYSEMYMGSYSISKDMWGRRTFEFSADNFQLADQGGQDDVPATSANTADFGSDMAIWTILFIVSLSALICFYRERRYE